MDSILEHKNRASSATEACAAATSLTTASVMSASNAAPEAAALFTTQDSLMDQLPPNPPSPYHPLAQKRIGSVLPSLFQSKLETTRLRDRKTRQLREAAAAAEVEFQKTQGAPKRTLGKDRAAKLAAEQEASAAAAKSKKDTSVCDEAIREFHFFEARRRQVSEAEATTRTHYETKEDLCFTRTLLAHFEGLARAITASELTEAEQERSSEVLAEEEAAREAAKVGRAEERRALLEGIAVTTSHRLASERLQKRMESAFAALLPAHAEERTTVMAEEQEALLDVFAWEKQHRPLGAGCFLSGPEPDPRARNAKKVKKSRFHKMSKTELTMGCLRSKGGSSHSTSPNAADGAVMIISCNGSNCLVTVDPPNTTPESLFVEEGKESYTKAKSAKFEALRRARAMEDLFVAEEDERADLQLEESEAFMPLLLCGVDGIYEARRAVRTRQLREAEEDQAATENHIARVEAKCRVLAADYQEELERAGADSTDPRQKAEDDEDWLVNSFGSKKNQEEEEYALTGNAIPDLTLLGHNLNTGLSALLAPENNGEIAYDEERHWMCVDADSRGCNTDSMLVSAGDTNSVTFPASPLGLLLLSSDALAGNGAVAEQEVYIALYTALADAREAMIRFLREDLWSHDLLMPEAMAALLVSQDGIQDLSADLLMELASARADLVNEQVDAVIELLFHSVSDPAPFE